jgi:dienelactone hydrolase
MDRGTLELVDVVSRARSVLLQEAAFEVLGSPDGKYVAVLVPSEPKPEDSATALREVSEFPSIRILVLDQTGRKMVQGPEVRLPPDSMVWSADSRHLAYLARGDNSQGTNEGIYIYDVLAQRIRVVPPQESQEVRKLNWLSTRLLALCVSGSGQPAGSATSQRAVWKIVDDNGLLRGLSGIGPDADIDDLYRIGRAGNVLGIGGGRLWVVNARKGSIAQRDIVRIGEITSLLSPAAASLDSPVVAVKARQDNSHSGPIWWLFDNSSGKVVPLKTPEPGADLRSLSATGSALFIKSNATGVFSAWLVWRDGRTETLFHGENQYLNDVDLGETRTLRYRDSHGNEQGARLLLPPGYVAGRRYPLIVVVYPGLTFPPPARGMNSQVGGSTVGGMSLWNTNLLTARGYSVLYPSMPLYCERPSECNGGLYDRLASGLQPAIDKAIELGVADPDRLGIMGHSGGGYATMAIISQTHRFKAAVSVAGMADLISNYGSFDPAIRFSDDASSYWFGPYWSERGQGRLGSPPWEDVQSYVHNSPLFHAAQIQTPLLIAQGDLDFISIQQGEEMFTALHRLDRRCQFARYWGEGHVFKNPVQIEDLWKRTFAWFDEFLCGGTNASELGCEKPNSPATNKSP